uniref:Uncharacterized protein n=1 Tax=Magallana gigas TaxID=29159 RepID=A0A8W8L5P8_MAGGI
MEINSRSKGCLVAAIEMGVKFSTYAFSFKSAWRKVYTNQWAKGSHKTSTCLLLKKDLTESLFGYEAEEKHSELQSEDCHCDFYFFKEFTTILLQGDSKWHALCYDVTGKSLEAGLVFEHAIRYLKKCLLQQIETGLQGSMDMDDVDIDYVFTVPAIGDENTKMFIREAAVNRSTMGQNRLNALTLLQIHRDIPLDYKKIVDIFINKNQRRMVSNNPFK